MFNIFSKKEQKKEENNTNHNNELPNNLDQDCFAFTNYLTGIKGLPLNTRILLFNNINDNTLDLIYAIDGNKQIIRIKKSDIKDISCIPRVRLQKSDKQPKSNELNSFLLSHILFAGNPLLQATGSSAINVLFDAVSNNYDKINLNTIYEINIVLTTEEKTYILNSDVNPEEFINRFNNYNI